MRDLDRATSLFWLALSLVVCVEALRLGIGTLTNPGMGFMAFATSVVLALLSSILFIKAHLKKSEPKVKPLFAGRMWKRVLLVVVALSLYTNLMPVTGYLVGTFLFMSLVFRVANVRKWWSVLVSSLLTTLVTYYVFSVWLGCQFPEGFLQFEGQKWNFSATSLLAFR